MFAHTGNIKGEHSSVGYQSSPGNYINLFKSRKIDKSINKTSSNGASFRITTTAMFNSKTKTSIRNLSPTNLNSPFLKKRSLASTTSPDHKLLFAKTNNNVQSKDKLSTTLNQHEFKKIIYVNEKTKEIISTKAILDEE